MAIKMQKYNKSAHVDSTHIAHKAAADDEQHLMSVVQSAVAKHFATPPSQPNLLRRQPPNSYALPSSWGAVIEWANNKMNKST